MVGPIFCSAKKGNTIPGLHSYEDFFFKGYYWWQNCKDTVLLRKTNIYIYIYK